MEFIYACTLIILLYFIYKLNKAKERDNVPKPHLDFRHVEKLANQGDVNTQFSLGRMYLLGEIVRQDNNKAFKLLKKAADQGHADSQFHVGAMYHNGIGVQENDEVATYWYKKAATKDQVDAQYILGSMYYESDNFLQSKFWMEKACENNHGEAKEFWDKYELWKY